MQIVYFSHSYRQEDQRVNDFFSELMKSEQLVLSLDPPSDTVNTAKLQRHLNGSDGMVAVLTRREPEVSPYIRFEIDLCLRSGMPLLVFVEDMLPDDLIPGRVLQRRFSRGTYLRQVREHRHALSVFKSYLGAEPPARYQPGVSQRACVIAGDDGLDHADSASLDALLATRGYRVVRSSRIRRDESRVTDALVQAEVAVAFVDATSRHAQYARGLLHGASVPTIELTATAGVGLLDAPPDFQPVHVDLKQGTGPGLEEVTGEHLSIFEEDFLALEDQGAVHRYFDVLLDIGAGRGHYSKQDQERAVSVVVMGDQYIAGQAGAQGPGSRASHMTFSQTWNEVADEIEPRVLAEELGRLRERLREDDQEAESDVAIGVVAEAQIKAQDGDGPAALERLSVLKRLKGGGAWVVATATAIGTTVAGAALKAALGL